MDRNDFEGDDRDWPVLGPDDRAELLARLRHRSEPGEFHGNWLCPTESMGEVCRLLHGLGARLLTLAATPDEGDEVRLTYSFELHESEGVVLQSLTLQRTADSLFSLFASADYLEREVSHLFGVKFVGHPNLATWGPRDPSEWRGPEYLSSGDC